MSKHKCTSTSTRPQDSALLDITSTIHQLQNGSLARPEETQALEHYALLAKARAGTDEQQPQKPTGPKSHKPDRGAGYTLRRRMEFVEIFHHLKRTNAK
ncbi:hypothetical protein BGX23_005973, partial [Mortierella sp. AD031]